jgi:hypothetical protein
MTPQQRAAIKELKRRGVPLVAPPLASPPPESAPIPEAAQPTEHPDAPPIPQPRLDHPVPQEYKGEFFPRSEDRMGEGYFDSDTGILGMAKRAIKAPGEVYKGELDARSPEGASRALEFAALASPVPTSRLLPLAGKASLKPVPTKAPSAKALKQASDKGYKEVEDSGLDYTGAAVKKFADDLENTLNADVRIAENNPELFNLIGKLQNPPAESFAGIKALDKFRQRIGEIAGSPDKSKAGSAAIAIEKLDEFLASAGPASVVAGTAPGKAQAVAATIEEARGNAAAGFRSGRITKLQKKAKLRADASNSGRNYDNTIRQKLASLLEKAKETRGLSTQEVAAIEAVIEGGTTKNVARYIGNLLGGGGGFGQVFTSGVAGAGAFAAGGGEAAILAATVPTGIGAASKSLANAMTKRELKNVDELIRSRSPLADKNGPRLQHAPQGGRAALIRALAASGNQQNGPFGP